MSCTFSVPFTKSAEEVLAKAKKTVESQDGTFEGNEQAGNFSVSVFGNSIAGSYAVSGQNLDIVVSDKPFMIPCSMIESFLKDKLS